MPSWALSSSSSRASGEVRRRPQTGDQTLAPRRGGAGDLPEIGALIWDASKRSYARFESVSGDANCINPGTAESAPWVPSSQLKVQVVGREATREGSRAMAESVYKVIELVGTSSESWEKAAAAAIARAGESLRDLRIAEVSQLDMQIEDGKVSAYRAKVKVSFKYEGGE